MILPILEVVAAVVLLFAAFIHFLAVVDTRRAAQINNETARMNTDIQASLMKLMDDNLAREKERQQWVATVLEAKAE